MKTRRQLIQIMPALPAASLFTASGMVALLSACGDKTPPKSAAPAPAPAPAAAAAPAPIPAPAVTAAGPMVDEKDPQAVALGYVNVAANADKTKFPKYADGQACSNCSLYQSAPGSAQGACALFAGKQVAEKAWCSAYNKKAA